MLLSNTMNGIICWQQISETKIRKYFVWRIVLLDGSCYCGNKQAYVCCSTGSKLSKEWILIRLFCGCQVHTYELLSILSNRTNANSIDTTILSHETGCFLPMKHSIIYIDLPPWEMYWYLTSSNNMRLCAKDMLQRAMTLTYMTLKTQIILASWNK